MQLRSENIIKSKIKMNGGYDGVGQYTSIWLLL